ncbi:winged helix-turn-helix domain-containing protein [Aneurinibacillus tyrosinisolvens]|uniref:winged helix-turn-helix domain-containing protein n=1 Tax=Aneurinibacillus tyrosinisolvens TaxID=1443435 RepID=UPI00128AF094
MLKEKFSVTMKCASIAAMFHRMNLCCTRSNYRLAKANPKKQQGFTNQLNMVKTTLP